MRFLLHSFCILLFSASVYAEPTIHYDLSQQRYTFPEQAISTKIFFSEISQYSGIEIYYSPDLIIPDIFRGISMQEDELLNLLAKQFSLIKAFQSQQLASLRILPTGKYQSDALRHASSDAVTAYSENDLQDQPVQLSTQRLRVLKAKEQRAQSLAEIHTKQAEKKEAKKQKQAEKQNKREQKQLAKKQKDLRKLKRFKDTDPEIYARLLPFYQHRYGEPDFSELSNNTNNTANYD